MSIHRGSSGRMSVDDADGLRRLDVVVTIESMDTDSEPQIKQELCQNSTEIPDEGSTSDVDVVTPINTTEHQNEMPATSQTDEILNTTTCDIPTETASKILSSVEKQPNVAVTATDVSHTDTEASVSLVNSHIEVVESGHGEIISTSEVLADIGIFFSDPNLNKNGAEKQTSNIKPVEPHSSTHGSNITLIDKDCNSNTASIDFSIRRLENVEEWSKIPIPISTKLKPPKESNVSRTVCDNQKNSNIAPMTDGQRIESLLQESSEVIGPEPVDREVFTQRKVDIYTEDVGPKWYNPQGNIVTPPIVPKRLAEAFTSLPIFGVPNSKAELKEYQNNKIREFVGCALNDEEFDKVAQYCSPDQLRTGRELTMTHAVPVPGLPQDTESIEKAAASQGTGNELCIVKKRKMRALRDPRNQYLIRLKYRGTRLTPLSMEEPSPNPGPLLQPGKDLLFRVRIYRPFLYNLKEKPNTRRHSVFNRDVLLLSRHRLSDLRERFTCANDLDLRVDVSERLDARPQARAKELFPSGFMFVNNVFYVDERPGSHDTSAVVRAWAERRGLGRFPRRNLHDATLEDLVLKLGHPEVYVHQGGCEHLFTFSEIRLLGATDPLRESSYPCHSATSQHHTIYCTTCAEFNARWIVTGCNRVPFDPAFFCDVCIRLYLYKGDRKIGDFKVYSYVGNDGESIK